MNICFPSLSYPLNGDATSGVGSQVRLLAHSLIDSGNSISVVDLAERAQVVTDDRGAEVHRMRCGNLHWYAGKLPLLGKLLALPVRELEYSFAVLRGVREANKVRKLDLIEGTETGMLFVSLFCKAPVVIRLHGEQYTFHKYTPGLQLTSAVRFARVLQRIALRRAKLLISPSYAHAQEIQNEMGPAHPPIVVVPNSFNLEKVHADSRIKRSPQTVLYVGRIEQRKGIGTLLEAAARTKDLLPNSRFVFAGDFHSSLPETEFRSLVSKFGLDSQIEMLGPVGWNVLSDWYQRSAVSVLPSYYETFGLAALEPMAHGTPVITTSGGALSEVVESEVSGRLVRAGDAGDLAGALTELLGDDHAREEMGKAALTRAATFDVSRVMPLNARHYEWCRDETGNDSKVHLFFSPHLDDAVLSCGGTIHSLVSQDKAVQVITVFAGNSGDSYQSAFARHLNAKCGSPADLLSQRLQEDEKALRELGVTQVERWNFSEAPFRRAADGNNLYATYDELRGQPAVADQSLKQTIAETVFNLIQKLPADAVLYFPLALGGHVDHQILLAVGMQLNAAGKRVRFYEDYPYAESYRADELQLNWLPRSLDIDLKPKLKAASAYGTQIRGLGGSVRNLERRLRRFGSAVGRGKISERYWEFVMPPSAELNVGNTAVEPPLLIRDTKPALRDFKNFLNTFRWHDLKEVLPAGDGNCLDVGCGVGRHRGLIESRGYKWLGLDCEKSESAALKSDGAALPLQAETVAAVVAWQVFEYLDQPEKAIAEAARVLETGGSFCGSVSFLEPVHGSTYFNLSPLILEKLLAKHGFADIEIRPGLNGFALMFWTWLRRCGVPGAARIAIPAAFTLLAPLSALLFFVSWLGLKLGIGSGHTMCWLSQTAPREFAGHVMFSARKKAQTTPCTSVL